MEGDFTIMRIRFTHVRIYDSTTGRVTSGRNSTELLQETFENGPEWSPVNQAG